MPLAPGTLVRVPLGKRELLGVVWDRPARSHPRASPTPAKLRAIAGTLDGIAPLSATWRQLVSFAASYYQRALGEVALAALPPAAARPEHRCNWPAASNATPKPHAQAEPRRAPTTPDSVALSRRAGRGADRPN